MTHWLRSIIITLITVSAMQADTALPPAWQTIVDDLIASHFSDQNPADISVEHLPGSHSAGAVANLLLSTLSQKYALKIRENTSAQLLCEQQAMRDAAALGIGPVIYYTSPDGRVTLMEFVEGDTLTVAQARRTDVCAAVARAIRLAHTMPANPYMGASEDALVEALFQEIKDHPPFTQRLHAAMDIIRGCVALLGAYDAPLVPCHGDLNSRNIFITAQGPRFIDWEYTSMADPFEDLAYYSFRHNYDAVLERLLLQCYLERRPTTREIERFYLIKRKELAKLSVFFHYFAHKLDPYAADYPSTSTSWAELMVAFAERRDAFPLAQLYAIQAACALAEAQVVTPP